MTTNSDIVNDILREAYLEIVGRGLISLSERQNLDESISYFVNNLEERELTEEEIYVLENKEYLGYSWKEQ